jgi:ketosteroid isomerase-like protein
VRIGTLAIAIGLCLLASPSWAQTCKPLSPDDVAKINAHTAAVAKAANSKDWAAFAAQYVEDAVLNPPNEPAVKGRAAIQAWLGKFPPLRDFTATNVKVEGCNDFAYAFGNYSMTLLLPGSAPIKDAGKFMEVRRRQANGQWLVVVDMFNSNLPAAPPPAPATKK